LRLETKTLEDEK